MNKAIRLELSKVMDIIEEAKDRVEQALFDEEDYRDNMPENLQGSERYEKAVDACDQLQEAVYYLEGVLDFIEAAQE